MHLDNDNYIHIINIQFKSGQALSAVGITQYYLPRGRTFGDLTGIPTKILLRVSMWRVAKHPGRIKTRSVKGRRLRGVNGGHLNPPLPSGHLFIGKASEVNLQENSGAGVRKVICC